MTHLSARFYCDVYTQCVVVCWTFEPVKSITKPLVATSLLQGTFKLVIEAGERCVIALLAAVKLTIFCVGVVLFSTAYVLYYFNIAKLS